LEAWLAAFAPEPDCLWSLRSWSHQLLKPI